jgi:hypothetical protein
MDKATPGNQGRLGYGVMVLEGFYGSADEDSAENHSAMPSILE